MLGLRVDARHHVMRIRYVFAMQWLLLSLRGPQNATCTEWIVVCLCGLGVFPGRIVERERERERERL